MSFYAQEAHHRTPAAVGLGADDINHDLHLV